jgi:hypothetical protein
MKRICSKCKKPIKKDHRWHFVHRKFLWWTFTKTEHRDCARPTEIHKHVVRLKGEVPIPFADFGFYLESTAQGRMDYDENHPS